MPVSFTGLAFLISILLWVFYGEVKVICWLCDGYPNLQPTQNLKSKEICAIKIFNQILYGTKSNL